VPAQQLVERARRKWLRDDRMEAVLGRSVHEPGGRIEGPDHRAQHHAINTLENVAPRRVSILSITASWSNFAQETYRSAALTAGRELDDHPPRM